MRRAEASAHATRSTPPELAAAKRAATAADRRLLKVAEERQRTADAIALVEGRVLALVHENRDAWQAELAGDGDAAQARSVAWLLGGAPAAAEWLQPARRNQVLNAALESDAPGQRPVPELPGYLVRYVRQTAELAGDVPRPVPQRREAIDVMSTERSL